MLCGSLAGDALLRVVVAGRKGWKAMIMRGNVLFAAGAIGLALALGGCAAAYGPPYGETLSYGSGYGPWDGFYNGYWGPGFAGGPFFVGPEHFHHFDHFHQHFAGRPAAPFAFHTGGAFAGHGMRHGSGGTRVGFGGPHAAVSHRG